MTMTPLNGAGEQEFHLISSLQWWDREAECHLVLSQPRTAPEMWAQYADGARRSYRKHGVECALDLEALRTGSDTVLFMAAVDDSGRMLAGVRAKGPLRSAEDSHAVVEWHRRPGEDLVRKIITDRLPFGVLEMKSAWVIEDGKRNRALTRALARSAAHAMALMDIQFCMATSAAHVLQRWQSSGGVVAAAIPATPYPDHRYQTRMLWWDRCTYAKHAEPEQLSRIVAETRQSVSQYALLHSDRLHRSLA